MKQFKIIQNTKIILWSIVFLLSFIILFPLHAEEKVNPFDGDPEAIAIGKSIYAGVCIRCHGQDGVTFLRPRDLKRFNKKYKNWNKDPNEVFFKTVTQGRPSKGMPGFGNQYTEEEKWKIKAYINSIQNP